MKHLQQDCSRAEDPGVKGSDFIKTRGAPKEPEEPVQRAADHRDCTSVSNTSPCQRTPLWQQNSSCLHQTSLQGRSCLHGSRGLHSNVTRLKLEEFLPDNFPTTESRVYFTHSSMPMLILILYSGPGGRRKESPYCQPKQEQAPSHALPLHPQCGHGSG